MEYKELLSAKFKIDSEEHLDRYINFCIDKNRGKKIRCQTEAHHILPKNKKSFPEFIKSKENIVHLDLADHIRAHILLFKAIRTYENSVSVVRTLGNIPSDVKSEEIMIELSYQARKIYHEFMNSDKNPNIGKKRSFEARQNLRNGQLNRDPESFVRDRFIWITDGVVSKFHESIKEIPDGWKEGRGSDTTSKISVANTGKIQTEETKRKRSNAMRSLGDSHHTKSTEFKDFRSNAWKENNPGKSEHNRQKSSERMKEKLQDPEYRKKLSEAGKKNAGMINIYNPDTNKFARSLPNEIPIGWINATGIWAWKFINGKREREIKKC